ncbi:Competence protein A [Rubripirellula obstinata]|uniref:Competence protein A n=1 Tax=Rubripirellula obstinata TaxID=406547 RepID=A0A5B1CQH3_9BACT|nr:type IV pilus assembly protein PilM [Rubripirellula obstinata]KAA1261633.1 Competence protein A [Rubripirellula obstinata]
MARSSAGVWGIEIGQTAIKALRCSLVGGEVVADAFDYIEYPKILSQPEADADELINEALAQLLQRNDAINEKVCISVPGQSGLAKFFKPPPVEVKKISDIVRYEARQQIPFDLADVVWDFQIMPGSMVEEGYALESEVGLFAMKREMAYRQLAPFDELKIEVDEVQLAPIALFNMLTYDRMNERVENDIFDADNPPPSTVLLSIGTDSSDLIVTNGFRIWQRSMPIGGNHFTRQLTKDLKLTFAKAEHLKRNAREAVDPKLVFQTMRPVFNDLVTEVQRSIGFFRSIDKKAEIEELVITGNTVKMPGLAAYLGKNLGFEVSVIDRFNRLGGEDVHAIPTFRDNATTFAVCYGLCLQGLGVSQIHASLVPQEILTQRMVRAKKPWTLAALAALLAGMTIHYGLTQKSWATTHEDLWGGAKAAVTSTSTYSNEQKQTDGDLEAQLTYLNEMGTEVSGNAESRLKWLEVIRVINDVVPRPDFPDGKVLSPKELPYVDRKDIHVTEIETKFFEDLATWWSTPLLATRYREELRNWVELTGEKLRPEEEEAMLAAAEESSMGASSMSTGMDDMYGSSTSSIDAPAGGPEGPGWVIQLSCYHYHNEIDRIGFEGSDHVRRIMTTAFRNSKVKLPIGSDDNGNPIYDEFTMQEMGIDYPFLLNDERPREVEIANPDFDEDAYQAAIENRTDTATTRRDELRDADGNLVDLPTLIVRKHEFIYQFVWKENTLSERLKAREEARIKAEEEAALAGDADPLADPADVNF